MEVEWEPSDPNGNLWNMYPGSWNSVCFPFQPYLILLGKEKTPRYQGGRTVLGKSAVARYQIIEETKL